MATRWGGLRIEPYDPNAIDADNDGIVQEGTAWERPRGLRLLDTFGAEIRTGLTSGTRPGGLRYVRPDGTPVAYKPRSAPRPGGTPRQGKPTALANLGFPSLQERGLRTLKDINGTIGDQAIPRPPVRPTGMFIPEAFMPQQPEVRLKEIGDRIIQRASGALNEMDEALLDRASDIADSIENMTPEEKGLGTALVAGGLYWATYFKDGGAFGAFINDLMTGILDSDESDAIDTLRDFFQIGGSAAIGYMLGSIKDKWGLAKEQINDYVNEIKIFMERIGVKAGELSKNLKEFLQKMAVEFSRFFSRTEDIVEEIQQVVAEIPSQAAEKLPGI